MHIRHYLKIFGAVAIMLGVAACASLEGENWPSLHEGFSPRQPVAGEDAGASDNLQDRSQTTPQTTPQATPQATEGMPEELAASPQVAPAELQARLDAGLAALEASVRRAESSAAASSVATANSPGESDWYAAQLELTRLSRMLDEVRPYSGALVMLQGALRTAKGRLERIKPESN